MPLSKRVDVSAVDTHEVSTELFKLSVRNSVALESQSKLMDMVINKRKLTSSITELCNTGVNCICRPCHFLYDVGLTHLHDSIVDCFISDNKVKFANKVIITKPFLIWDKQEKALARLMKIHEDTVLSFITDVLEQKRKDTVKTEPIVSGKTV